MPGTDEQNQWIGRVLGIELGGDQGSESAPLDLDELGLSVMEVWGAARDSFRAATEEVDGQIRELQAALRESDDMDLQEIAEFGLNALTGNTRVPLLAALQEASGGVTQLKESAAKVKKAIADFRNQLNSEPRVAACDDNPFGVTVAIVDTYEGALDALEHAVSLA